MKNILGLILCLAFVGVGFSQTLRTSDSIPIGKIGVVIYASSSTDVLKKQISYTVFLDGKEIAQTHPGRYFIAVVNPGTHSFQIGKVSTHQIVLEIKETQSYYLRVNKKLDDCKSEDFEILARDKAQPEMKDFKMIDNTDVKEPQIAINWQEG